MPPPSPPEQRHIDGAAVASVLRRMALQSGPPWLHSEIARRMADRLQFIKRSPSHIIDWGSFLGAGGSLLNEIYPRASRTAVEPSAALALRSRTLARGPWWKRAANRVSVLEDNPAAVLPRAELLWSNMALHAVTDPPTLVKRWQDAIAADGFLMFSCLGPATLTGLRDVYRGAGWGEPTIGFVDMHDLGDMLVQAGFADPVMDQETLVLTWTDAAAFLRELRQLGGNVFPERFRALRTPRWRKHLLALLDARRVDGRLEMQFEVTYGHAFKAPPRLQAGGETAVSLDDMRTMLRSGRSTN